MKLVENFLSKIATLFEDMLPFIKKMLKTTLNIAHLIEKNSMSRLSKDYENRFLKPRNSVHPYCSDTRRSFSLILYITVYIKLLNPVSLTNYSPTNIQKGVHHDLPNVL